jgi:hypothetical protein
MPEEQNVYAEQWKTRLNEFLGSVLSWKQLGESNTDIYCDDLKRKVGIDSVFAYKRNEYASQQVVFVEAKTVETLNNLSRAKIEEWVTVFLDKIVRVPHSHDFFNKFQPEGHAVYGLGLIGLWVRNADGYSEERLSNWLSQLSLPGRRQNPVNIAFISNRIISSICAITQVIRDLKHQENYVSIEPYFPIYGDFPATDGKSLPIESTFSKFFFYTAQKKQYLKSAETKHLEYPASIVFYTGEIESYDDLRFIGLALRQFQIASPEIEIYTLESPTKIRNEIKVFREEFAPKINSEFKFNELTVSNDLPGWL